MNNLFQDLKFKVFKSGNPIFLYIGINTIIFVLVSLIGVGFFLSASNGAEYVDDFIKKYLAFPASFSQLPSHFYTIITYQFFHGSFLHLLFNMLGLFWMGQIFLDFLKPRQFHFVYLAGGITGALFFTLAFHIFPVFINNVESATIIGSSACVMAIVVAAATLVPDYALRMLLLGDVKLKYLALAYVTIDIISITSVNPGGSFAHLGGALLGFVYIKLLQNGKDWSVIFKKKPKLKVVKNENYRSSVNTSRSNSNAKADAVNQQVVDSILDKISKSGYDKLSKEEKETLFKASKH